MLSFGFIGGIDMKKGNPVALLPIGVFLVLYLGLGLIFEYVLKIPMGFYNIPIVVVFLIALLDDCHQAHGRYRQNPLRHLCGDDGH